MTRDLARWMAAHFRGNCGPFGAVMQPRPLFSPSESGDHEFFLRGGDSPPRVTSPGEVVRATTVTTRRVGGGEETL